MPFGMWARVGPTNRVWKYGRQSATAEIRRGKKRRRTNYRTKTYMSASATQDGHKLECGPMPNVMAALPNIDGALCSTAKFGWRPLLECRAVTRAKTRNSLKFQGVPETWRMEVQIHTHDEAILKAKEAGPGHVRICPRSRHWKWLGRGQHWYAADAEWVC